MTEHDWRKPHEKKVAKKAKATTTATAKASDWKAHREAPKTKGNAHVSKEAWTKRSKRSA
jgi:hypothetical protein